MAPHAISQKLTKLPRGNGGGGKNMFAWESVMAQQVYKRLFCLYFSDRISRFTLTEFQPG